MLILLYLILFFSIIFTFFSFLSINKETIHMSYKIYLLFHFIYLFNLEVVFASVKSLWYLQVYGVCMCNICKCSVSQSSVRKEIMRSIRKCWACCTWFFFCHLLTHAYFSFFVYIKKKLLIGNPIFFSFYLFIYFFSSVQYDSGIFFCSTKYKCF